MPTEWNRVLAAPILSICLNLYLAGQEPTKPASAPSPSNGAPAQAPSREVLRTSTRLVVVDVIATSGNGNPITDLKSAKSLAAHLCGLCVALAQKNDPVKLKPELPAFRGSLTIAHVSGINDPEIFGEKVETWARSAWHAYEQLNPIARDWLTQPASVPAGNR